MKKHKILVIDNDLQILKVLKRILTQSGFEPVLADDGTSGIERAVKDLPDLIIIDRMMPGKDGIEVASEIKRKPKLSQVPILMLTSACSEEDKVSALESYIDDYFCKPFSANELIAKIKAILRHSTRSRDSNPTTNLPGGNALEEQVNLRLRSGSVFALMHIDIDNFKAYADSYGFNNANKMIKLCGEMIGEIVESLGDTDTFISHVGGDDFIIITELQHHEFLAREIIKEFDEQIGGCFKEEDVSKGCFMGADRKGEKKEFPITTLSIGIISNEKRAFQDASEMGKLLVRAKNRAKLRATQCHEKSSYFFLDEH